MPDHIPVHQTTGFENSMPESEGGASFAPPPFQLMASSLGDNPDGNSGTDEAAQFQTEGESVRNFAAGETDPNAPDLESYRGEEVNLIGRIGSDEANYATAVSSGMNIRSKPLPTSDAVIGQLRYNTNVTVKSTNISGGWYFVIADNGTAGWINQAFVALHPPDSGSVLHQVTEPDLTTILKNHYVKSGLWNLETGDDYTTLAAAVKVANAGRKGIYIDLKKRESYKDDNPMRETFDPMSENFADYASAQVVKGTNIWLPSPGFINQLKEAGAVASRADWLNTAMDMGDALVGFHAGMYSGIYGSLWDTLVGLYNIGEQVVGMVKKCFTGEILEDVSGIYSQVKTKFEEIGAMSQGELLAFAGDLLSQFTTAVCDGAQSFADSWTHPDTWKAWFFRGKVIGQIVLEVVLAIFTAGAGTAAKWLGTIGKFSPKLARIVSKGMAKADDLLPSGMKKNRDKPDADGPDRKKDKDNDDKGEDGGPERALILARQITEMHDAQDSPIPVLKGALAGIQRTFKGVDGYKVDPKPGQSGHYSVVQMMPKKVDDDYTTKSDWAYTPILPEKTIFDENGIRVYHNFGNLGRGIGSRVEHGPVHFHVKISGDRKDYFVFPSGKAMNHSPELPAKAMAVFKKNKSKFNEKGKKIGKWYAYQKSQGNIPK